MIRDLSASPQLPLEFWALAALAIVADARPFPASGARRFATVYISVCFTFAIMLLWGVGLAIMVQTAAVVGAAVRHRASLDRTLFTIGRFALALVAAQMMLDVLGMPSFEIGQRMTGADGLAFVAAAGIWFAVNYGSLTLWLRLRTPRWRPVTARILGYEVVPTGALLLLGPLLVGAPVGWSILLVLVPVVAVNRLARLYGEQDEQLRHDPLTGLFSRQALIDEVENLASARGAAGPSGQHSRPALLLLDLDRFKQVNDALGHAIGDRLLGVVARRLTATVRRTDLVARLGGDEFAVLAWHIADAAAARTLAGTIARSLAAPAEVDGQLLDISASIGVALYPDHGEDYPTLMRHADVAMYEAKRRGNVVAIYSAECDHNSPSRLSLLADFRRALDDPAHQQEISFCYQPQIALKTGEVAGVEALLRWRHPERGLVDVEQVLQAAEHSPVIRRLTRRLVDDVVEQLARWTSAGLRQRVSINVSVRDLDSPDLVDHLADALRRHRVRPTQVQVEITETALMGDQRVAQLTVQDLASLGVALSLDDFGTGYSSLAHLRRLPVAEIKIDRSFVGRMARHPDDYAIVRSTIDLAGSLGLRVVAEGVEDEQTCRLLVEAGCDVAQGWHFARAMPAEEFVAWLRRRMPAPGQPHT